MFEALEIQAEEKIICGGDWNSIFNVDLDKCGGRNSHVGVVPEMKAIMEALCLSDLWRIKNPTLKRFTFRQRTPLVQTRLDYFLTSDEIHDLVTDLDIIPSVCSDHSCITMKLCFLREGNRGRGYWKFNSQHLQDEEFVANMSQLLETSKRSYGDIKKRVVWELIKYEIRKYCIKYGKQKRKNTNLNTGKISK